MDEPKQTVYKPWKVFAIEAFLFSVTLFLGIITSYRLLSSPDFEKAQMPQISPLYFIVSFLIATIAILITVRILKFKRHKTIIFKILFIVTIFSGALLLISTWLPSSVAMFFTVILIILWLWRPSILTQDIAMVLGIAGVGSFLGLAISPNTMILLLVLFSVYDFIAVFKTKHMVEMAKAMIDSKAILGFVVPPDIKNFKGTTGQVVPGGKFLVLGGGDIVFPLLFCSSLVYISLVSSFVVAFFALLGLLSGFLIFITRKRRHALPALPPIAFFSIIGFLLTRILL